MDHKIGTQPYQRVSGSEESLWRNEDDSRGRLGPSTRSYAYWLSLILCLSSGWALGFLSSRIHLRENENELSFWRPSLGALGLSKHRFKARLYDRNAYRGPPGEAVDAEWDRWTTNPWMSETAVVLNVSAEEIYSTGNERSMETIVQLDSANGGGYMATIELFHQLHCLNLLRKWTFPEYYGAKDSFFTSQNGHRREHTDHCIDIIRERIMCSADLGMITFHWVKDVPMPSPNFNTLHQCRDPESVLQWAHENAAQITHHIWNNGEVSADDFF